MSDLISRQAAVSCISDLLMLELKGERLPTYNEVYRAIYDLPSAQPERPKGKWIYNSPVTMKCNQCGLVIKDWDWHMFKYCPNCGARMDGD